MQRNFLLNVAFLIFVNLLVKPFWIFGIDRTVQNMTGPADYGLYFAVFNFSFLFYALADLGLNHFNTQSAAANPSLIKERFSKLLSLKVLFGAGYFLICLLIAWLLKYDASQYHILYFLALNQVFITIILYFRSNFGALHWFGTDSMFSVLDRILVILICGILIWTPVLKGEFRIEYFVYAQTAAWGFSALLAFLFSLKAIEVQWSMPDLGFLRETLKSSLPFALLFILMTAYQRTDAVMIERMLDEVQGKTEAGIYAASYRLLDAFSMIGFLFATFLLPVFSRLIAENKRVDLLLKTCAALLLIFSVSLSVNCVFYTQDIMPFLYNDADAYYGDVFIYVVLALNGVCMMYAFGALLTANKSLKQLNIIALSGFILNIILNIFLIKLYEAKGAAIATLITQAFVAVAHVLVAQKVFTLSTNWKLLLKLIAFSAFTVGIAYLSTRLSMNWIILFLTSIIASVLLAFLLQLIDFKQIKSIADSREGGKGNEDPVVPFREDD